MCQPGPAPSTRHVDLTGFRNGAYGVKARPGPGLTAAQKMAQNGTGKPLFRRALVPDRGAGKLSKAWSLSGLRRFTTPTPPPRGVPFRVIQCHFSAIFPVPGAGSRESPAHAPCPGVDSKHADRRLRRLHEGAEGAEDCSFDVRAIFGTVVQSSPAAPTYCDRSLRPPQPRGQKEPARPALREPIPNRKTLVKRQLALG